MDKIEAPKREKVKGKTPFTNKHHHFIKVLDENLQSRREVWQIQQELEQCLDDAMDCLNKILDIYIKYDKKEAASKVANEL